MIFKLGIFITLLYFYIWSTNKENIIKNGISLSLNNIFIGVFSCYTFLPILSSYINNKTFEYVDIFYRKSIIIIICLLFGNLMGRKFIKTKKKVNKKLEILTKKNIIFWNIFLGIMNIIFLIMYIIFLRGGIKSFFSLGYRQSLIGDNTIITALLFGIFPYAMIFLDRDINKNKFSYFITHIFLIFPIIIFIMGGQRNFLVILLICLIFLGLIAIFREYNIINILSGKIELDWNKVWEYIFSFENGELGTTLAFEKYKRMIVPEFSFPFKYGYSYTILPLLNIVPKILWKNKPLAYGDYFSQNAFGYFDGIGYGFSPIYEAEINFGMMWWLVFVFVGFFISWQDSRNNKKSHYYTNILIASLTLNFFRIDFAVCFKFFIMMNLFKYIYLKCINLKRSLKE